MNMTKTIGTITAFVLLLMLSDCAFSQCKFKVDRVRKSNGDTVIATKSFPLYSDEKGNYNLSFLKNNSDYFVSFRKAYSSSEVLKVVRGMTLLIMLKNESEIKLVASEDFETNQLSCVGENCSISVRYPVSQNQLQMLSSHGIKSCNFFTLNKNWSFETKSNKKVLKAQEGAKCILTR